MRGVLKDEAGSEMNTAFFISSKKVLLYIYSQTHKK